MSRSAARAGIPTEGRLQLVESDLDQIEDELTRGMEKVDQRLAKIMWALVGLLISVATTCIVLIITLGIGR